jgi:hypothetical protein
LKAKQVNVFGSVPMLLGKCAGMRMTVPKAGARNLQIGPLQKSLRFRVQEDERAVRGNRWKFQHLRTPSLLRYA